MLDNGDVMSDRRFTGQALDLARRTGNRLLEHGSSTTSAPSSSRSASSMTPAGHGRRRCAHYELGGPTARRSCFSTWPGWPPLPAQTRRRSHRARRRSSERRPRHRGDLEAAAFLHLGVAHSRLGHGAEARVALTRSRDLFVQNGGEHYAVDPIAALAFLDLAEGETERAMDGVEQVLAFTAAGDRAR